jgi:hypothetical protein
MNTTLTYSNNKGRIRAFTPRTRDPILKELHHTKVAIVLPPLVDPSLHNRGHTGLTGFSHVAETIYTQNAAEQGLGMPNFITDPLTPRVLPRIVDRLIT